MTRASLTDAERCRAARDAACCVAELFPMEPAVVLAACPARLADLAWALAGRGLFAFDPVDGFLPARVA